MTDEAWELGQQLGFLARLTARYEPRKVYVIDEAWGLG